MKLFNRLGFCETTSIHGNDFTPCQAARVSYGNDSLKGHTADTKLLRYLLVNEHTSPFEQCSITYRLCMPIFVARQFIRHRTFRLNEQSARYSELPEKTYIPKQLKSQSKQSKQGSAEPIEDELNDKLKELIQDLCTTSFDIYRRLLNDGVSKEQARIILPLCTMTTMVVNIDLNNLIKFFVRRIDAHAQYEMRVLASAMWHDFRANFPIIASIVLEEILIPKNITPIPLQDLINA